MGLLVSELCLGMMTFGPTTAPPKLYPQRMIERQNAGRQ